MGMCAELIATGPFSPAVAAFLDYPVERFATARHGAIVTRRLFGIEEGSTVSREFAALLGISDPWDFSRHAVDLALVDRPGLVSFAAAYPHYADDVRALGVLLDAGFDIHFRPEG
ncbi:hypothetical protein ACFJIW_20720 [Tahibacter sp. UC22_41]|uniref:hypothetical protein n=1 Tax=Tahibacter sp. UC22_41 TaxID=3350178 RepID=UPI0036D919DD